MIPKMVRSAPHARRWRGALAVALLVLASCRSQTAEIPPRADYAQAIAALDSLIEWHMETKDLPALSIALVDDQEIVWARGFGYVDTERTVPATANTVYRVGSVSKMFTDIAIMQLVDREQVDLDASMTTYLPDFDPANPYGEPVTLRQLMSHRSGLVREPPVGNYFDDSEPSLAATVASLNSTTLVYEPATRFKYSNAGIAAAGYMLERTQGVAFAGYVKASVLEPLGMHRSAFTPDLGLIRDLATAYMWGYDGRTFVAPKFELGMAPAGSMYSTVLDLGSFMSVMFAGGERGDVRILERESLNEMWVPQLQGAGAAVSGYGFGFEVGELDGRRLVRHGGAIYGFATELALLPEDKLGAVVVTAKDGANAVVTQIAHTALRSMVAARQGRTFAAPPRTDTLPRERVRTLAGHYTNEHTGIELYEWRGRLFGLPDIGGIAFELRRRGDSLVVDGVLEQGGGLQPLEDGRLVMEADTLVRRPERRAPPDVPDRWRGLIGEYGWDHNTLFILEKAGRLHALIEWFYMYPLEEEGPDVFAFPDFGLYHGERLVFTRDAAGQATQVDAASVVFQRRTVGPSEGNTFRIEPVRPVEELRAEALAAQPPEEHGEFREPDLVELVSLDPSIKLDIRYASTDNFMGAGFYAEPRAFMQRPAAEALVRAHRALRAYGYGLLIHDAYRPWYVTKMFWDATPEDKRIFVANPATGSRHNRGCAVDLTLYDLSTGRPVEMVGTYDEMTDRSYADYLGGTARQRWYRQLLRQVMEAQSFEVYEFEWWHFDYRDWARYPILNLTFDQLR